MLVHFWTRVGAWLDNVVEVLIGAYHDERARITQGAMAKRIETVAAILDGRRSDADRLPSDLRHPIIQIQTAFVVWVDDNDLVGELENGALEVARILRAPRPLIVSRGSRDLWCWIATRQPPALAELARGDKSDGLLQVHVAFGSPRAGIAGFRVSHSEAIAAQRLTFGRRGGAKIVRYTDVELVALMSNDAESAERYIARTLGKLATDHDGMSRLRQTVYAWLMSSGTLDDLAATMTLHRNTVRYRIRQAETVLGYSITDRRVDVEAALRYLDVYGRL